MLSILAAIFTSFMVSFAMKRGGLCTYAAVLQIVHQKRLERMLVFLGAAAWATLIVLPLHWSMPGSISLSLTHNQIQIAVIGGAVLGLGAFLNKGCFFGTFVQLVGGNLNYLATLAGLSAGTIITLLYFNTNIPATLSITDVAKPELIAWLWFAGMFVFAVFMVWGARLRNDGLIKKLAGLCTLDWKSSFAMITIGIGGGLLYGTVNGWNYADVLANASTRFIYQAAAGPSMIAIISTVAMIIGGIVAAVTAKEFAFSAARLVVIISCFLGGMLMGAAALLTPGGNDGLLLKGIPGLAPHALIGYASMVAVMLVLVYLFRGADRNR